MNTIHVATCDFWEGLYINGLLTEEDGTLNIQWVLKELDGRNWEFQGYVHIDEDWMDRVASLPKLLGDVKRG